jgi:hypothetical protein
MEPEVNNDARRFGTGDSICDFSALRRKKSGFFRLIRVLNVSALDPRGET